MENLNKAVSHGLSWFSSCPTRIFSPSLLPLPHLYMLGHPRTQVIHSEVFFVNTHLRSSHSLLSPQMYLYTDSQQIYVPGPEFSTVLEQLSNRMSISKINTFSSCFPTRAFSFHFPKSINDSSSDTQFLISSIKSTILSLVPYSEHIGIQTFCATSMINSVWD